MKFSSAGDGRESQPATSIPHVKLFCSLSIRHPTCRPGSRPHRPRMHEMHVQKFSKQCCSLPSTCVSGRVRHCPTSRKRVRCHRDGANDTLTTTVPARAPPMLAAGGSTGTPNIPPTCAHSYDVAEVQAAASSYGARA